MNTKSTDNPPPSGARQRYMVLCLLQQGPVTSLELRGLGVLNPAARLSEIRQKGYPVTVKILPLVIGPTGVKHKRIAQYRLSPDGE